jgi:hypothetical protein
MTVKNIINELIEDLKECLRLLEITKKGIGVASLLEDADAILINTYTNMNEAREKIKTAPKLRIISV